MGRLRKVLVGAVAALATLAAGLVGAGSANAAPPTGNENIELQPAESGSTLNPNNYTAYEIVRYTPNGSVTPYTSVSPSKVSDDIENTIARAMNAADPSIAYTAPTASNLTPNGAAEGVLLNLTSSDSATIAAVARELSRSANASIIAGAQVPASDRSQDGANVKFSNLDPGLYLIKDSSNASLPILVSSTLNSGHQHSLNASPIGSAKVKTSTTYTPTKHMMDSTGANISDSTYEAVGDTVHFKITMTIPDSGSYQAFTLTDSPYGYDLSPIDSSNVKMYYADSPNSPSSDWHEISFQTGTSNTAYPRLTTLPAYTDSSTGAHHDAGFTITDHQFDTLISDSSTATASWIALHHLSTSVIYNHPLKTLIVTYKAKVTRPDAANAVNSSVTPFTSTTPTPVPGNTVHNGGTIGEPLAKFTKVAAAHRNVKLGNVTFSLRSGSGSSLGDYWTSTPVAASGHVPAHLNWTHSSSAATMTTSTDTSTLGQIDLDGLPAGTYTLHEVSLPSSGDASHYLHPTPGVTSTDITITVSDTDHTVSASAADPTAAGLFRKDSTGASAPTKYTWHQTVVNGVETAFTSETTPGTSYDFSLGNLKNISELPATGGAGIIAGIILVALLLAIGGSFIAISRKMHKDRQQAEGVRA